MTIIRYKFVFIAVLIILNTFAGKGQGMHDRNKDLPCLNKQFNIYVHLIYNEKRYLSTGKMYEAVESANKFFSPICVSFKICKIDTVFNYNYNILGPVKQLEELITLYGVKNRINLYVSTNSGVLGQYNYCYSIGTLDSIQQGASFFIGKEGGFAHELGHYFGLEDTFKDSGRELVDGSNCKVKGDRICDTPADPYVPNTKISKYLTDCVYYYDKVDANGERYRPDVGNVMSYYLNCQCGFSYQQYMKIVENYNKVKIKHW